jgi:hypothetical protein
MTALANPGLASAADAAPVVIEAPVYGCSLQFDALGRRKLRTDCDVMRTMLTDAGVPYRQVATMEDTSLVRVGEHTVDGWTPGLDPVQRATEQQRVTQELRTMLATAGYPVVADPARVKPLAVTAILVLMMLASTALYGPQAAALVELFPTRVRYTALSVPYNVGVGWVGGLLPVSAFALVASRGDIYAGLLYPLLFTLISIVCAWLFLPETRGVPLDKAGQLENRNE